MRILGVDTTSAHGSVAVLEDDRLEGILGLTAHRPRHAESLLPTIDYLMTGLELSLEDVGGFAVSSGPGSFTGVRIGIAAVEGLAYATGRPAAGVSALEATVYRYRYRRGVLAAFIDAYRGEVYGAAYRSDGGGGLTEWVRPVCEPPQRFLERFPAPPDLVAGSATVRHRDLLEELWEEKVTIAAPAFFLAEEVARLARRRLESNEGATGGTLEAFYLRPSDAERQRGEGSPP